MYEYITSPVILRSLFVLRYTLGLDTLYQYKNVSSAWLRLYDAVRNQSIVITVYNINSFAH